MNNTAKKYTRIGVSLTVCLVAVITFGLQFVQSQNQKEEITKAVNQIESMKSLLQIMQKNNVAVPQETLASLEQSLHALFTIMSEQFTTEELAKFEFYKPPVPVVKSKGLDEVIEGGLSIKDMNLKVFFDLVEARTRVRFVMESAEYSSRTVTANFVGNLTIRKVLDEVLPAFGLAFKQQSSNIILINTPEKFNTGSLYQVVEGGMVATDITLGELANRIKEKTRVQINLGNGLEDKIVSIDKPGDVMVKEILSGGILGEHQLGYTENKDGVIYIDTSDNISKYPGSGSFAISYHMETKPDGVYIDGDGTIKKSFKQKNPPQPGKSSKSSSLGINLEGIWKAHENNDEEELNKALDAMIEYMKHKAESTKLNLSEEDAVQYQKQLVLRFNHPQEVLRERMLRDALNAKQQVEQAKLEQTNHLEKRIQGSVTEANLPLKEFIYFLQLNANIQIVMDEEIGKKQATFNIEGSPTVKEALDSILPPLGLIYEVQDDGVVHIFKKEK